MLTDEDQLTASGQSIIIPRAVFNVWPGAQAASNFFDDDGRPALSQHVSYANQKKLLKCGFIKEIDNRGVIEALQYKHPPKPESWRQLLNLWAYIAPVITVYRYHGKTERLCVVPAQGKEVLCASNKVIRLGEKKLLPSEDDWRFLGDRLWILNQNWLRYLTEQRRVAETSDNDELSRLVDAAYAVLKTISLDVPSNTGKSH